MNPEKNDYDCVIIDTPPAIDVLKSNALIAASHIPWAAVIRNPAHAVQPGRRSDYINRRICLEIIAE
ncbi:MAG TPA: hypothetical protein EYQ20_04120 [candidate division Zixibacteria bacterium]|nr:hypothetical protein [candidate division Zixibacteria bacterium]